MDLKQADREILGSAWTSPHLWQAAQYLCDECSGRFAGTQDERRAGDYLAQTYRQIGLSNVAFESFEMNGWERGDSRLQLALPDGTYGLLPSLALACSPAGEVEAEVIDIGNGTPEDFARLGDQISGKIVITGTEGPHRSAKYASAAQAGAVGFLFFNNQPGMLIPAGSVRLQDREPATIPALGLALESAQFLQRKMQSGSITLRMFTDSVPQVVTARNVIAEIPGTDPDAGWIVVGGHYDGHDIAQGAQDNGTGTLAVLESARLLFPLRDMLKAGIRFIHFSGEELGLNGSFAYVKENPQALDSIRAVFNADIVGIQSPLVLMVQGSPELAQVLRAMPLEELDAIVDERFVPHSDHFPFNLAGISTLMAVTSRPSGRGGWVHSSADTLDKLELRDLRQAVAATARILLRLAMNPENLPQQRKSAEEVRSAIREAGYEKILDSVTLFTS